MTAQIEPDESLDVSLDGSTLDDITAALWEGIPIRTHQNDANFTLDSQDARDCMLFYANRKELWPAQRQIQGKEIDELLQAIEAPDRKRAPVSGVISRGPKPRWAIVRIEAHRFAGLHRHCDDKGKAPAPFILDLQHDVTCIWGFNGAGKTALHSAITWCLTGLAPRSQRLPQAIHTPIAVDVLVSHDSAASDDDAPATRELAFPPIVPLPQSADLAALGERPAIDTWVKVTFRDDAGREVVVKRELVQGPKGAITNRETGLSDLGLPAWAISVGCLMPALAAAMRFDEKTTFADAIAQLTGLKPLEDLGRRSERLHRRLSRDESTQAAERRSQALLRYQSAKQTLTEAWMSQEAALGEAPDLVAPTSASENVRCREAIEVATQRLDFARDQGQLDIESLLGTVPPLDSPAEIANFVSVLTEAKERFTNTSIAQLPSIELGKRIAEITATTREKTYAILQSLQERALAHVARLSDRQRAARWQLYAMVSRWHGQHHASSDLTNCPVCLTDLGEVPPDALVDKDVADALQLSADADADVAKSLEDWQRDAASELLESVAQEVRVFADRTIGGSLAELYRTAFVDELFQHAAFRATLKAIKDNAGTLWEQALTQHPLSPLPERLELLLPLELTETQLSRRFRNIQQALSLAEHRESCEGQIKAVIQRFVGGASYVREQNTPIRQLPLRQQIVGLQQAIEASQPILALLRQLNDLESQRYAWEKWNKRYDLLQRASEAVKQFTSFPALVHRQVTGLLQALESGTQRWLDVIYRPHYLSGPNYSGIDPKRPQGVGLYAGMGTLRVHAHEVMNASHLRACVWAFLFSLWERSRDQAGCIDVMLLDDPQTFFDPINTENLAAAIPQLAGAGMRLLVTSNDNRFIAAVKDKLPKASTRTPSWTLLQISPISTSRLTCALVPAVEEVLERRETWRADENDPDKAQRFVERVRLFVENRLWDLLAADPMLIYKPTLADLVGHIAAAKNAGELPFNEPPFERLVSSRHLRSGTQFYAAINHAHHDLRNITPQHAKTVDEAFDEVNGLLRSASAAYARFMGRLSRDDEELLFSNAPAAPQPAVFAPHSIRILGDFSARTYANALAIEREPKTFALDKLGDIALFVVRGAGLGALARPGQVVLASLTTEAKSGDPVIAMYGDKVFARRYHADVSDTSKVALVPDISAKERVAPALTLPRSKVRLLPIVGVLYEAVSHSGNHEAAPIENAALLNGSLVAAQIVDDSGYPVVRNGDLAILERISALSSDMLDHMKDEMVAVVVLHQGEAFAYLKRVGLSLNKELRILDNIGTFGSSMVVACNETGSSALADVPTLHDIWKIKGVLRVSV